MVQMKVGAAVTTIMAVSSFISHMVQMKDIRSSRMSLCLSVLYIPHGSDEREIQKAVIPMAINFISHMVQMKAWMQKLMCSWAVSFISHMVQMKVFDRLPLFVPLTETLYPTWFR